jgi:hypothetical protein
MRVGVVFAVGIMLFASCEKKEIPVPPHEPGDMVVDRVEMNPDYRYQIFYSLSDTSVVSQNLKTDWDLGFECGASGWHMILNTSLGGGIARTGLQDFSISLDTLGAHWYHDAHSGNLDSTALGDYRDSNEVYILDRGYHYYGYHMGFVKFKIEDVNETSYIFRWANLDGSNEQTASIIKDETLLFTAFSFEQGTTVPIFPHKDTWDLMFTQYLFIFIDPPQPYMVSGVRMNRNDMRVAIDPESDFETMTYEDVQFMDYKERIDAIGYDWKWFDLEEGFYVTHDTVTYIIQGVDSYFYKLRFTSFYNETGQKGTPNFEYQRL